MARWPGSCAATSRTTTVLPALGARLPFPGLTMKCGARRSPFVNQCLQNRRKIRDRRPRGSVGYPVGLRLRLGKA
jgi:hypothetical protein